jgi:hypothetical protein
VIDELPVMIGWEKKSSRGYFSVGEDIGKYLNIVSRGVIHANLFRLTTNFSSYS